MSHRKGKLDERIQSENQLFKKVDNNSLKDKIDVEKSMPRNWNSLIFWCIESRSVQIIMKMVKFTFKNY